MANAQHRILSTEVIGTFTETGYRTETYEERLVMELVYSKGRGYYVHATLQAHGDGVQTTRFPNDFAHALVLKAARFNAKTLATTTPDPAVLAALRAKLLPESRAIRLVGINEDTTEAFPPCSLAEFVKANCDADHEVHEMLSLKVGDEVVIGGGAAPMVTVRRVA